MLALRPEHPDWSWRSARRCAVVSSRTTTFFSNIVRNSARDRPNRPTPGLVRGLNGVTDILAITFTNLPDQTIVNSTLDYSSGRACLPPINNLGRAIDSWGPISSNNRCNFWSAGEC